MLLIRTVLFPFTDVLHLVKGVPLETHEDHPVMMGTFTYIGLYFRNVLIDFIVEMFHYCVAADLDKHRRSNDNISFKIEGARQNHENSFGTARIYKCSNIKTLI